MDARFTRRCASAAIAFALMLPLAGPALAAEQDSGPANNGLSPFVRGMARVTRDGRSYYIDRQGRHLFDQLVSISTERNEPGHLPGTYYVVVKDGKQGVITPAGDWIVKPEYDHIDTRGNDYWNVTRDGHESFIDADGLMLPLKFADVGWLDGTHFDVRKGKHWGIYDTARRKMVVPAIYDKFDYCGGCGYKSDYAYAEKNGKWGVVSFDGDVLVPFRYGHQHRGMRSGDWVTAFTLDGHDVVINIPTGTVFAAPTYRDIEIVADDLLIARGKNGQYGLVDAHGNQVAAFTFDAIRQPYRGNYSSPWLVVEKAGKFGVIDHHGKQILAPTHDDVTVAGDYFIVKRNGLPELMDAHGKVVIDKGYSAIEAFELRGANDQDTWLFELKDKALSGMYFPASDVTIKPTYSGFDEVCLGRKHTHCVVKATDRGVSTLYSATGQQLLPANYSYVDSARRLGGPGLIKVGREDHLGIYDLDSGKLLIPQRYASFRTLSSNAENYIVAQPADYATAAAIYTPSGKTIAKAGMWKIDSSHRDDGARFVTLHKSKGHGSAILDLASGHIRVLPYPSVHATGSQHLLAVRKSKHSPVRLYVIASGQLLPGKFADDKPGLPPLNWFRDGVRKVKVDGKFTVIDESGRPITPHAFDAIPLISRHGVALVGNKTLDKWGDPVLHVGYMDRHGKLIVPTDYHFRPDAFHDKPYEADRSDYFLDDGLLRLYRQQQKPPYKIHVGVANASGVILPPRYEHIAAYAAGQYFITDNNDVRGVFDVHGEAVIAPARQEIHRACDTRRGYGRPASEAPLHFPLLVERDGTLRYYRADGSTMSLTGTDAIGFASFDKPYKRFRYRDALKRLRCDIPLPSQQGASAPPPPPPAPPRR